MNSCGRSAAPFVAALPPAFCGLSFVCDLKDSIAREVCFTGQYEPQETALLKAILEPGMVFVDVGANWGYFTLLAAARVGPQGRVVSLEPDPRLARRLRGNVALSSLGNVEPLEVAAAAVPTRLTLSGYDERGGNFGLSRLVEQLAPGPASAARARAGGPGDGGLRAGGAGPGAPRLFEVDGRPIDMLLNERGLKTVDLLKMDIEGAEDLALRGMSAGLAVHRYRRILLEVHPTLLAERGRSVGDIVDVLLGAGYRGFRIDHSARATRRAAYARSLAVGDFLSPLQAPLPADAWPHFLWLSPGLAVPA
jgi:FkbM family methyltransferase